MELLLKNSQCTLQVKNPDSVFSSQRYRDAISTERKIIFSSLIDLGQVFVYHLLKYTEVYTCTMDNKYFLLCTFFAMKPTKLNAYLNTVAPFLQKNGFNSGGGGSNGSVPTPSKYMVDDMF